MEKSANFDAFYWNETVAHHIVDTARDIWFVYDDTAPQIVWILKTTIWRHFWSKMADK